ncbi:putative phosphopantothenoylcysteine decarboxylase protein [Lasiodiplodia theobromae]|uniref:Flavoprotein domain-containing protein n=1 Tax=Lasiodiplodia theobromae TaxID=45133 RepID=A0A5N5CUM8_9PEZI|nr:Phosphopantothenoylcysteine decarboxylase [Lasiodiplodia theobromae]KAB2569049.1 Uncharacterized protein DBV05_g12275 [Lasiodiplodia theobromae]KAF4535228.1 Phosphopantothenoylcysteine decarboxylase [Lasiodiplodia theobromae]KAF9632805.1 putative phosphopantothenoylcysteine decarboxylase protein [Lasiodiplodia theobromae]
MPPTESARALRILVASSIPSPIEEPFLSTLIAQKNIAVRSIVDSAEWKTSTPYASIPNVSTDRSQPCRPFSDHDDVHRTAAELCAWADLLVLAPMDANTLAKMLHGVTDSLILEILRSWDVSKRTLLVLGMSTLMWENPMTKKQISKIRRKWNWVRVLHPLLWTFESKGKRYLPWEGREELMGAIQNQLDLMTLGQDVDVSMGQTPKHSLSLRPAAKPSSPLPPEIWSMILDFTGDWELAKRLNVYTTLPTPQCWLRAASKEGPHSFMDKLEWAILTGTLDDVKHLFNTHTAPQWLSSQAVRIIMRFAMVPLLYYLESNHADLFWASFGHAFLPDKASAVFGRVEILEYWRTSPTFLNKEYTVDAIDGASRAGFVHILEWWRNSGLPMKYSEAALEQASSRGQIEVLEWWKRASMRDDGHVRTSGDESEPEGSVPPTRKPLRLKPGKAISFATQAGSLSTLRWWVTSTIPFSHEDTVAKLASTHGHVDILDFWQLLHGEKMIYDNQVLVGATKMGHRDVLEWWKKSGLRVEYKTCDIEEALEDGVEGVKGQQVRRWWALNGLNLGVGTSEWMRTKVLNQS